MQETRVWSLSCKIPWRRKWLPLQYSWLENPMDRGVWWASVHGVTKESDGLVTKGQHAADTSDLPMSLFLIKLFECFVAGKKYHRSWLLISAKHLSDYATFYFFIYQLMHIWGCFCFWAIMNNAAINISVWVFTWTYASFVFVIHLRKEWHSWIIIPIYNCLRNYQTISQSSFTILHSH